MTSAKCFSNWLKEAGRGHLIAFLSWGLMIIYGITMITRLSFDTDFTYFGLGSTELVWICAGLGILLAFFEFFYLLQPRKQDLYYSLPVSKSVIFWSRYVHGLMHFLIPLVLVLTVCGVYEGTLDAQFLAVSAGYTGRSILSAAAVFLIFYHIGTVCLAICGNIVSAVLTCGAFLIFGDIFMQSVCDVLAGNCFKTYYRLPLVEKLTELLNPLTLAGCLSGLRMYEKKDVLAFTPQDIYIWTAVVWILAGFLMFYLAMRKRKAERTGRDFVSQRAERAAEVIICVLAGTWTCAFLLDISGMTDKSFPASAALAAVTCAGTVLAAHCALEWKMQSGARRIFRRKVQLGAEILAAICIAGAFLAGADAFDRYFPGEGEAESVGISIDGLGMDYSSFQQKITTGDTYETDIQLTQYRLSQEGRPAALAWLKSLAQAGTKDPENVYTHVTVCYYMKDGGGRYRTYSMTRADFEAFASVYETEEYKEIAYPAPEPEQTKQARFSWNDGVKASDMKVTADEKEALAAAYQADRTEMKMADLSETLPLGFVRIVSGEYNHTWEIPVYPSFEQTCRLLEKYGVQTDKGVEDYPGISVEMYESSPAPANVSGSVRWEYYDDPEDVAAWQKRLVPVTFDLQPLLCPLDYKDVNIVVEDTETNSTMEISCVLRREAGSSETESGEAHRE